MDTLTEIKLNVDGQTVIISPVAKYYTHGYYSAIEFVENRIQDLDYAGVKHPLRLVANELGIYQTNGSPDVFRLLDDLITENEDYWMEVVIDAYNGEEVDEWTN